jgi:hypothetical protein
MVLANNVRTHTKATIRASTLLLVAIDQAEIQMVKMKEKFQLRNKFLKDRKKQKD